MCRGGEIQLVKSKMALEQRGHEVILFDQWKHNLSEADVVHQFSVQGGIYNFCNYVHHNRIPLVISPILWLADRLDQYPMGEIGYMTQVADVICPNSEAEVVRFRRYLDIPAEKFLVTHNGVDGCFFDPVTPGVFLSAYPIQYPFVLCVGNIEERKNQLALLEANAAIGVHTVLIGNVRDTGYFASMRERFGGGFTYLGYMEHDSLLLRSAYSACVAFALPSLLETPGLAALEAAAVGAPLVITKEGCTEEYFGSDALYVDPKNVEDISNKILLAMRNKNYGGDLKNRVRCFSWDKVAEELEGAYTRAISTSKLKMNSN